MFKDNVLIAAIAKYTGLIENEMKKIINGLSEYRTFCFYINKYFT